MSDRDIGGSYRGSETQLSRLETCTTLLSKMGERDRERDRERITEIVGRELGEMGREGWWLENASV